MVRQVPNILSGLRIALSLVMLTLLEQPKAFVTVYVICGVSDLADGIVARRFGAATTRGAQLDSFADFVFYAVALYSLLTLTDVIHNTVVWGSVLAITGIRIFSLLITKVRFGLWSSLHTWGSKVTGAVLFLVIPICIFLGDVPLGLVVPLAVLGILAAFEESLIVLTAKTYDVNRKGYFHSSERIS